MTTAFNQPDAQVVSITDFSPGIWAYGRGQFGNAAGSSFSTPPFAPLGAAAFAVRCVNEPGVGLVPFWNYTTEITIVQPSGNSPGGNPWVSFIPVGIGTLKAGADPRGVQDIGVFPRADYLVLVILGRDSSGAIYTTGYRYWSGDGITPFNQPIGAFTLWTNILQVNQGVPQTACFTRSAQTLNMGGGLGVQLYLGHEAAINSSNRNPSVMPMNSGFATEIGTVGTGMSLFPLEVFAHGGRVNGILEGVVPAAGAVTVSQPTTFMFTDPPTSTTNITVSSQKNYFDPEEPSGIGAWGSISTGELLIITESAGAFTVSGDPGFPSFVNRLPAVHGTGQLKQRATACSAGLLYVTDTDGVYAWNGGNTSRKVSSQIPDNATLRFDLMSGSGAWGGLGFGAIGVRTFHDRLNQYVFFPNNWVFDDQSGSWWLAEDPAVLRLGVFQASACGDRYMYAQPLGPYTPGQSVGAIRTFDATTAAPSWTWVSSPIRPPAEPGLLPNLSWVEIVASDPGGSANPTTQAQFTITPQVLSWDNPQANPAFPSVTAPATIANNPQSVVFQLPGQAQGWRASQGLGFTESTMCIRIDAVGQGSGQPAPILHEIHLGFTKNRTSGV